VWQQQRWRLQQHQSATGEVTLGSNQSDAVPKKTYQTLVDDFQKQNAGLTVKVNTVDHLTFQNQINNYLQGKPDDVFTWFAGYRMRFFAGQGLAGDVSDVWKNMSGFSDAFKKASTGDDGKQYFVPISYYPWAIFYRKSVWQKYGYEVPKTLDDLTALAQKMKADGLVPIAFADKDGWPAMGTFDVLNLRINGYQYHVDLMAHKKPWTDPGVAKVFDAWKGLLPYHQDGALGRTWQEAAQGLAQKEGRHVSARSLRHPAVPQGGPGRRRLLHLPGDRLGDRLGRPGRAHRRLHDGREAQERGRREEAAGLLRQQGGGHALRQDRSDHADRQLGVRRHRLHRTAEEVRRARRVRQEHHAVPRP
jgi:hypothetical protein